MKVPGWIGALVPGAIVLAAAASAACGWTTEPVPLRYDFAGTLVVGEPPPSLSVTVSGDTITIVNAVGLGYPCYDVSGAVGGRGAELTLEVTAVGQDVICAGVVAHYSYLAHIWDLPSGRYRLSVVHVVDGRSGVTRQYVDVPDGSRAGT